MELFTIDDKEMPVLSAEGRAIPQFLKILDRDKTKGKRIALKEFAFIWFHSHYKSPVSHLEEPTKTIEAAYNAGLEDGYVPDEDIKNAIVKFQQLIQTDAVLLLMSARVAVRKLTDFFNEINIDERDDKGKPIYNSNIIVKNVSDMGKLVEGLRKLEDQVKLDQSASGLMRGGQEKGDFEDGFDDDYDD